MILSSRTLETLILTIGVALLAMGCSERHLDFSKFDLNDNKKLESYEFVRGYQKARCFRKWAHGKNTIPARKLAESLLATTDLNADQLVDKREFQRTSDYFYFGFVSPSFKRWDRDSDQYISKHEFSQNAERVIFEMWDTSGERKLSQHEMAEGIFLSHDTNINGTLDSSEFKYWTENRLVIQ